MDAKTKKDNWHLDQNQNILFRKPERNVKTIDTIILRQVNEITQIAKMTINIFFFFYERAFIFRNISNLHVKCTKK